MAPARRKSPVEADSSVECRVELADERSLVDAAARVPVAISIAAGASTALIICHDEGATDSNSTSCEPVGCSCWRSLALCFGSELSVLGDSGAGVATVVVGSGLVVEGDCVEVVVVVVVVLVGFADDLVPLVAVSLALLWPKLAASLLLISATAPTSAALDGDDLT